MIPKPAPPYAFREQSRHCRLAPRAGGSDREHPFESHVESSTVMLAQPGVELLHRGVFQDAELIVALILPKQLAERAWREQPPLVVVPWVQGDHRDPREHPVESCRAARCQEDDALRPYAQAL